MEAGQDELQRLSARIEQLELELAESSARANAAVAVAQDRSYWLDRMRLDLNGVMSRPLARGAFEGFRLAYRALSRLRRMAKGVSRRLRTAR